MTHPDFVGAFPPLAPLPSKAPLIGRSSETSKGAIGRDLVRGEVYKSQQCYSTSQTYLHNDLDPGAFDTLSSGIVAILRRQANMTGGIFRAVRQLQQCRNARSRSASLARPYTRSLQSKVPRRFQSTGSQYDPKIFRVSEEVQEAIATGKPVVALETTIYTHGFPYPDNVALATHLESVVRRNGGVPATIGVLDGVARVGLNEEEVIQIASAAGKPETMKVSRRDIPFITGLVSFLLPAI